LVDEVVDTTKTVVETMIVNSVTANNEGSNVVIDLFLFIEYLYDYIIIIGSNSKTPSNNEFLYRVFSFW
jgi:hypothetical protein